MNVQLLMIVPLLLTIVPPRFDESSTMIGFSSRTEGKPKRTQTDTAGASTQRLCAAGESQADTEAGLGLTDFSLSCSAYL
jgi:hypothetical protein